MAKGTRGKEAVKAILTRVNAEGLKALRILEKNNSKL